VVAYLIACSILSSNEGKIDPLLTVVILLLQVIFARFSWSFYPIRRRTRICASYDEVLSCACQFTKQCWMERHCWPVLSPFSRGGALTRPIQGPG